MKSDTDRRVRRDDIERYRQALTGLGGEASLEQLVETAGTGESDLGYIAACLIVPVPTTRDPSIALPFALSSAWGSDHHGRRTWRTEPHWTPDDLEAAKGFLRPNGGSADDHDHGGG